MKREQEPIIVINGTTLNNAQAMTIRCAVSNFMSSLQEDGLGNDEIGRSLNESYQVRLLEIETLLLGLRKTR